MFGALVPPPASVRCVTTVFTCVRWSRGEFIVMKEYNLVASSSESAAKRMELLYHEINLLRKSRHANIVRYLGTGA